MSESVEIRQLGGKKSVTVIQRALGISFSGFVHFIARALAAASRFNCLTSFRTVAFKHKAAHLFESAGIMLIVQTADEFL